MILGSDAVSWAGVWTFILALARMMGLLTTLPGIGTDQVPMPFRLTIAIVFAIAIAVSGYTAPESTNLFSATFLIGMEFTLGYMLGLLPQFIIAGLAVAGQVAASTMGIAQASLIDPTLGESVSVLSKIQSLIATTVFLLIDGHHLIFKAASGVGISLALGEFVHSHSVFSFILEKFTAAFEFGILIASPVLVAILVTQFVLGLVTRFVPQVNVFIVSLPLTIGIGLYIVAFSLGELTDHLIFQYEGFEEAATELIYLGVTK